MTDTTTTTTDTPAGTALTTRLNLLDTYDGPSANIAASRVALIGGMLAELDQAVKGGL